MNDCCKKSVESGLVNFRLDQQAFRNCENKLEVANRRVVEFEEIKQMHLQRQVDMAKGLWHCEQILKEIVKSEQNAGVRAQRGLDILAAMGIRKLRSELPREHTSP